jgi:hypothetical protein
METPSALQIAVSVPFLYAFFCIVGADPRVMATYYVGNPWFGWSTSRTGRDQTFSLFGVGPLVYTALVIIAEQVNPGYCSTSPVSFFSVQAGLAALTIFLVGKILFGPVLEVRKSIRIVGDFKFARPISFMLYDILTALPSNFLSGLFHKWIFVGAFAGVIWLLSKLGIISSSSSFIPFAIVIAWIIVSLGRVSALMVALKVTPARMLAVYLASTVVLAFVWSHAELLLRTCGVQASVLPSYGSLIGGLLR